MKVKSFLLLIALPLLLVSCGGRVPRQAIVSAKKALESARKAEADRYVPDKYNGAKSLLDAGLAEIEKQKEVTFSDYSEASRLLYAARDAANEAERAVAAKKKEVKQETEDLLAQISEEIKETRSLCREASGGKEAYAGLELIKEDLGATEGSVSEVNASLESGDYLGARAKAQAIITQLSSIQAQLQRHSLLKNR